MCLFVPFVSLPTASALRVSHTECSRMVLTASLFQWHQWRLCSRSRGLQGLDVCLSYSDRCRLCSRCLGPQRPDVCPSGPSYCDRCHLCSRSLGLQGLDVWRSPQMYVVGTSPLCARIPGLSPGQRRLCQLRQVSTSFLWSVV